MRRLKEVVIVEGRYDKNALSQVVDAVILETGGFSIFNDQEKQKLFRKMAAAKGLIILTDSDGAGFVIRNFIRSCVPKEQLKHAYIPDIYGKERRKQRSSKEGKLGVEGMRPEVLLQALERAGACFEEAEMHSADMPISKADLYAQGLSGGPYSRERRKSLMQTLELPEHLSADALLDVLNATMSREAFFKLFD